MLKIKIADSREIIGAKERWNFMVNKMKYPSVFLTWEWMLTWIRHFGKYYKLIVLFVYDNDDLAAIMPLAQRKMRLPGGYLNARALSICGSMELYPNHLDIICVENDANKYIERILDFLLYEYTEWDILHLAFLHQSGHVSAYLNSANNSRKYKIRFVNATVSPVIAPHDDFSAFLSGFGSKKRYNLNREKKTLFTSNNVTFHIAETEDEIKAGLEALFTLHKERADEKNIKSTFSANEILDFHRETAKLFFDAGWLRLYSLKNDDKVVAAAYGFKYGRKFYYYQTGMSPEWKHLSAGKILVYKILEDVFSGSEAAEFDFLGGGEDYKAFWTKEIIRNFTFRLYNKTAKADLEYIANGIKNVVKSVLLKN